MLIGQHQKNNNTTYIQSANFENLTNYIKITCKDGSSDYCYIKIKFIKQSSQANINIWVTGDAGQQGISIDSFTLGQQTSTSTIYYREIIIDKNLIKNKPNIFYIRIEGLEGEIVQCSSVVNILSQPIVKRIGIWGSPSQVACVNGVKIQLGKTGIYELNNPNIDITFVGFIPIDKNFVLDYAYE